LLQRKRIKKRVLQTLFGSEIDLRFLKRVKKTTKMMKMKKKRKGILDHLPTPLLLVSHQPSLVGSLPLRFAIPRSLNQKEADAPLQSDPSFV